VNATPTPTTLLKRSAVVWDHAAQMRAALDPDTLAEYTLAFSNYNGWGDFPPVTVFSDGANFWGADGFHRRAAFEAFCSASGKDLAIPCAVCEGDLRTAILHAAAANSRHGLRRSAADKRRAVEALLGDPEWAAWSDREIARRCNVSAGLVATVRAALEAAGALEQAAARTVIRNGQTYTQNVTAIGARPRAAYPRPAGTSKPSAVAQSVTGDLPPHLRDAVRFAHYEGNTFKALTRHGAVQSDDWNDLIEQIETLLAGAGAPSAPSHTPDPSRALILGSNDHPLPLGAPAPALDTVHFSLVTGHSAPALAVGKCRICNRPLDDPASVAAGIGPCCAAKLNGGNGQGDEEEAPDDEAHLPISRRKNYKSDEWYTQPDLIAEVRAFFGGVIGLDPASCELAQEVVQAVRYFTKDDNGLIHAWNAESVFVNPPYSEPAAWVDKAIAEHKAGRARRILLLVNNSTDTAWFQTLLRDYPVCFLSGRLAFWRPDRHHSEAKESGWQGSALFFLGEDNWRYKFVDRFAKHGVILTRSR